MNDEDADFALALQLQLEFQNEPLENRPEPARHTEDEDMALALQLQNEEEELMNVDQPEPQTVLGASGSEDNVDITDNSLELIDPTPDIYSLFKKFDQKFFDGKLAAVAVCWSARMTRCAGICYFEGAHTGMVTIRLSMPLLKLRPRSDMVETLLHEMIHAYLFVTRNFRDHDGHGPEFCKHMDRINFEAGTKISIYHTFHDEVRENQQHWWKCDGPCNKSPPYFGIVRRSMNRVPGPNDTWWYEHQYNCGGTYTKIKEPEGYVSKKAGKAGSSGTSGGGGKRLGGTKQLPDPKENSILPYLKPASNNSNNASSSVVSRNSNGFPTSNERINIPTGDNSSVGGGGGAKPKVPTVPSAGNRSSTSNGDIPKPRSSGISGGDTSDLWKSGYGANAKVATISSPADSSSGITGARASSGQGQSVNGKPSNLWKSGLGANAKVATINSAAPSGGGTKMRGSGGQSRSTTQVVRKPNNASETSEPAFSVFPPTNAAAASSTSQPFSWSTPGIRLGGNPQTDTVSNSPRSQVIPPKRRSVGQSGNRRSVSPVPNPGPERERPKKADDRRRSVPVPTRQIDLESSSDEEIDNVRRPSTQNSNRTSTNAVTECPVCLKVISNNIINEHLDVCLEFRNS